MKKIHILWLVFLFVSTQLTPAHSEKLVPDTVTMGMYILLALYIITMEFLSRVRGVVELYDSVVELTF